MIFFRTPKFWQKEPSLLLKCLLKPISWIYSFFATKNYFKPYKYQSEKSEIIAIGAVTVGGSGKTLVVKSLRELLEKDGRKTAILSRGYGRLASECTKVDTTVHTYKDVGDEPLMLAKNASVFVCKDRARSARIAFAEGYDYLLLDDGIVQKYLAPSKKFVVIDNSQKLGNGEMFPLGPNRLHIDTVLTDADAIFVLGNDLNKDVSWLNLTRNIPVIFGKLCPDFSHIKKRVIAFCGIGYPEKFFNSLKDLQVIKKMSFPDHAPFSESVLERLIKDSKLLDAQLITTEKDFMRIPPLYRNYISFVPVTIQWEDENSVRNLL